MPSLTPEERSARARAGAHALHAKYDSKRITAPARAAFLARFETQVDPHGELSDQERARRAEHARKAHMASLALRSAQKRRIRSQKPS